MDSGVQSPGMANYHLAPDPFHTAPGEPPLAGSMHAMVPYPYMPLTSQSQNADVSLRITHLEQKQFQDGVSSHHRSVQTSQWMQHLQQQLHQMQQAIAYDIPALKRQVQSLQAKLERKENDEATRQIELEPRTQEQKLLSALKNANLVRIYASTSMHDNATSESISLKRAEQMEALAASLRGRVYRGGAAYLSEAEDAEAWAAKLRGDVKGDGQPEINNKLLTESKTANLSHADIGDINLEASGQSQGEMTHEDLGRQLVLAPESNLAMPPAEKCASRGTTPGLLQNTINATWDISTPEHSVSAKNSIYPHTPSAQRSRTSKDSASAISIKIKKTPESNVGLVQVKAVPGLQPRRLEPHIRYATQQIQVPRDWNQATEATTNEDIINTQEVVQRARAQVSSVVPPHRRFKTSATPMSGFKSTQCEMEESKTAEVTALQSASEKSKEGPSPVQEKSISIKNPRRKKNKKPRPHRSVRIARAKALERSQAESIHVDEYQALPSETAKSNEFSTEPEIHEAAKVEMEESSGKQNDYMSTLDLNTSVWQPTYLKELPLLSSEELQDIPSSSEMHAFNRTFITTHLGGMKWLPSFYSVPEPELSLLPGRGYFLFEDSTEPLAPSSPGAHGSLITPILRLPESDNPATPKPESMQCAPLFIKRGNGYVYNGMYSHLRSDRLDLERCNALIPSYLKDHWAAQLTSPHRPRWVTEALQNHLRPPPSYTRPSSSASSDAITAALDSHHRALESWHRDTSLLTSLIRPANILTAFAAPDTGDATPGLRFWCLGLKCEGWEKGFYDMMCREEKQWEKEGKRDGEKERERRKDMLRILGNRKPVKW